MYLSDTLQPNTFQIHTLQPKKNKVGAVRYIYMNLSDTLPPNIFLSVFPRYQLSPDQDKQDPVKIRRTDISCLPWELPPMLWSIRFYVHFTIIVHFTGLHMCKTMSSIFYRSLFVKQCLWKSSTKMLLHHFYWKIDTFAVQSCQKCKDTSLGD